MSLEKQSVIDQITVSEDGTVFYRTATRIIEDGAVISQTYHRSTLVPGTPLDAVPTSVAAICNVAWTPEVIAEYQVQAAQSVAGMPTVAV